MTMYPLFSKHERQTVKLNAFNCGYLLNTENPLLQRQIVKYNKLCPLERDQPYYKATFFYCRKGGLVGGGGGVTVL